MASCLSRRTCIWRYCAVASFVVYIVSFAAFMSLMSPKSISDDVLESDWTVATSLLVRNSSWTMQREPSGGVLLSIDETKQSSTLKPTKRPPTALEDLHKNMTLHKANMSDLLQHVKAAVANRGVSDGQMSADKKVANPHPFKYLINSTDICADRDIYVIAYVHTAPDHYKRRVVIRQTWGDASYYSDVKLRVVFVMGRTADDGGVQQALEFEAAQYGDIVQEDFLDTYRNLTYKGVAALKWISERCAHARYVLKTDDDIFVNTFNLLRHLRRLDRLEAQNSTRSTRGLLLCLVWYSMTVMRDGKWKVSKDEWPDDVYPTYCSGSAFVMSTDVAVALHGVSYHVPFFWVDDFYITGLLALKLEKGVVQHTQFMSAYVLNGAELETKFTGPQWWQYIFSHVHNLNAIQAVWKTVVRLARGDIVPTIPFALPGHLPKPTSATGGSEPKKTR